MANWDFIFAYTEEAAAWLTEQNYPCPAVLAGNRAPTTADMKWALGEQRNLNLDYPAGAEHFYVFEVGKEGFVLCIRGFDWDDDAATPDGDSFAMRWMGELQAAVLTTLCRRCGQLIMWPDTGAPAIIFQAGQDPQAITAQWNHATQREEGSWKDFFERMYAQ